MRERLLGVFDVWDGVRHWRLATDVVDSTSASTSASGVRTCVGIGSCDSRSLGCSSRACTRVSVARGGLLGPLAR